MMEWTCCRLIARNGNPMSRRRFAGLGEQIAASLDVGDAILDREVIAADEIGRPQFLLRQRRAARGHFEWFGSDAAIAQTRRFQQWPFWVESRRASRP